MKKFSWGTVGLTVSLVFILLSPLVLSVAGDMVIWFAVSFLPLLLPLTLGTKEQKVYGSLLAVFVLYLMVADNRAGQNLWRNRYHSVMGKYQELKKSVEKPPKAEVRPNQALNKDSTPHGE